MSANPENSDRLIVPRDIGILLLMILLAPAAWIFPQTCWRIFSYPLAWFVLATHPRRTRARIRKIRRVNEGYTARPSPFRLELSLQAALMEQHFQYLREMRPGRWNPRITLRGREQIDEALQRGRGAVLWVARMSHSYLVVKKALHRAGFGIYHLSRPYHGSSATRFGRSVLNRIRIIAESRYLIDRLVIPAGGEVLTMRKVQRHLQNNHLISITCSLDAHKKMEMNVLKGRIHLATGPVRLALETGAPLIPVFTVCLRPGEYEVDLGAPLAPAPQESAEQNVAPLLAQYAEQLESYMLKYPKQVFYLNEISPPP